MGKKEIRTAFVAANSIEIANILSQKLRRLLDLCREDELPECSKEMKEVWKDVGALYTYIGVEMEFLEQPKA